MSRYLINYAGFDRNGHQVTSGSVIINVDCAKLAGPATDAAVNADWAARTHDPAYASSPVKVLRTEEVA